MATEDARKLFVAGLPDTITEDVLRQLFEATGGTVVEVSIPRDRATGRPRGFGFVTLSTSEEAASARHSLDGSFQAGKSISVRPFQAEPPRKDAAGPVRSAPPATAAAATAMAAPDRTLYVGNLPYDCSQEEIEGLIQGTGAGEIARVNLPIDVDGRKRGFGFVTMETPDAARAAMEALRGAEMRGRRLVINIAHPKGERPARSDFPAGSPPPARSPIPQRGSSPHDRPFRGSPFAAPQPDLTPRKTFDERRRSPKPDTEPEGRRRGGGGAGRWDRDRDRKDWEDYDDDD